MLSMHAAVLGNSVAAMSALRGNSVTPMSALPGNSVTPMSALPGNSVTPMAALLVESMAALRMQGPAGRGWPVRLMVAAGMAAGPALHRGARGMAAAGTAAGSTLVHMTAVAPVAANSSTCSSCKPPFAECGDCDSITRIGSQSSHAGRQTSKNI